MKSVYDPSGSTPGNQQRRERATTASRAGIRVLDFRGQPSRRGAPGPRGFTLLELMFAVGVAAILGLLAVGQFGKAVDKARNASAVGDISMMAAEVERFRSANNGALPADLSGIGRADFLDPWKKRPYIYTNLTAINGNGKARKDHRLNPINSDYDLFSAGANGVFKPQVSQKDSLDDVIRARDGGYIGLAEDF